MGGSKGSKILNLGNSGGSLGCHKTIQVEWIVLLENDNSYLYRGYDVVSVVFVG